MWSPNLVLIARTVRMRSSAATLPLMVGKLTLDVCDTGAIRNAYECGDVTKVTGDD